jgi:hypothetical protein
MLAIAGLFSVITGVVGACFAGQWPARAQNIETAAGALLLGGFALFGWAMPAMV